MAIEKNINEALVKNIPSAKNLIKMIFDIDRQEDLGLVALYHQFPLYIDETGENSVKTDVLFISQNYGIIIFKCIEFSERIDNVNETEIVDSLNQIDRLIFAKILKDAPSLTIRRRDLKISILPTIYLHNCQSIPQFEKFEEFTLITSAAELKANIFQNKKGQLNDSEYKDLKATIEGSKGLVKPTPRTLKNNTDFKNSKGAILSKIESDIYNFDLEQKRAALFTLDGAQRIRGLAGSGKTVVLAMKAALIHLQNPNAEILYTYYTKSLFDLVRRLITRFYRQFAEKDPDWNKIHIMHAWGGRGLEGVYYNTCNINDITPLNLTQARSYRPGSPFSYICEDLNSYSLKQQYDYSLLDEAQDFPDHFFRLCRKITKNNRVIWAYDDFQNILNIKIQDERITFGKDDNDQYYIDFSRRNTDELQDLVLYKCYRNPKKVLLSAFALGLGIYNKDQVSKKPKVLQRLENNEHWQSLGFTIEQGNSNVGNNMVISRPDENSPALKNLFLNDTEGIIKIITFDNFKEECQRVCELIIEDLEKELNPEDISVIALDNQNVKSYFTLISRILEEKGISTFSLIDAPTDNTYYKVPNHVTLSTIFKAKGNESGSIYIVGIDAVFQDKDNIIERNKLFTAMTRSLAWVTLTGTKPYANICLEEMKSLKSADFKLIFVQPSEEDVNMVRQDISERQRQLNEMEKIKEQLSKLGMTEDELKNHLFKTGKE